MRVPVEELVEKYRNNLYAAAFNVCRNTADAEDIAQDVFLQYHFSSQEFESEQHLRAWLLRAAINKAKNVTRSFRNRNRADIEDYMDAPVFETPESHDLFETVMKLPEMYRIVVHLFYYEGYTIREIAEILGQNEGTVKVRLSRARRMLKNLLKEEWDNDE